MKPYDTAAFRQMNERRQKLLSKQFRVGLTASEQRQLDGAINYVRFCFRDYYRAEIAKMRRMVKRMDRNRERDRVMLARLGLGTPNDGGRT